MKEIYVKIEGIHCNNCESKIKKELLKDKKIKDVKINKNIAYISYNGKLDKKEIIDMITGIDYITKDEYISEDLKQIDSNIKLKEFIIILICISLVAIIIKIIFGFNIFNMIPTIDSSITYGMLIITGMFTSIHCISMCGAINLMAVVSNKRGLKNPILYNIGRVISYTIIGGIAGLIGSILSINQTVMGFIIVFAALIMFLMSLSMLGIIKFRLPRVKNLKFKRRISNSFILGIINGFMPCGPLQAMQLYALSTGNFIFGALSMFLFGIGTVPLMLSVGIIFNFLKGKKKIIFNKIASVLILILSLIMLNRGLLTLNIDVFKKFNNYDEFTASVLYEGYQTVEFDLDYDNYEDIILQKDIPVKMIIHVSQNKLTGCNNEIIIKDFGIKQTLEVGDNVIEFLPTKVGTYTYTCWMNMIKNNIKVIDDKNYFKEENDE